MGLILNQYKKVIVHRYDDNHIIQYLHPSDFPSFKHEEIKFTTKEGNVLAGVFYNYEEYDKDSLVIFVHGIGGGHLSYLREIEKICQNGYRVLAFDMTGCFASTGENIRGLSESLNCLDTILNYIENDDKLKNLKLHIIGHSWGGFTSMSILSYHTKNIKSVCAISGFITIKQILNDFLKGKHKLLQKVCYKYEKKINPSYYEASALLSLKNSEANILIIHSKDDTMVPYLSSTKVLQDSLNNNDKIKFLIVDKKGHNPHYTLDAINYMNETFSSLKKLTKEKKLKTLQEKQNFMKEKDLFKMTEQDEEIWNQIFNNMEIED